MTKSDVKKRIAKAIQELNAMDNNVCFAFEETEYSVELSCQAESEKGAAMGHTVSWVCSMTTGIR